MSELPAQNKPFNHRLMEILESEKGVFIGEIHSQPALRQALTCLMPLLKAQGVSTLSFETTQADIDEILKAPSRDIWLQSQIPGQRYHPTELYSLVKEAQKHGIHVIGHEDADRIKRFEDAITNLKEKAYRAIDKEAEKIADPKERAAYTEKERAGLFKQDRDSPFMQELKKISDQLSPLNARGMQERNQFAADYIKEHSKPGKIVVMGGFRHSSYGAEELQELQENVSEGQKSKPDGLDTRLGIPSIIIRDTDLERVPRGVIGDTRSLDKKTSDVLLPSNLRSFLKENGITSWPPSPGDAHTPSISELSDRLSPKPTPAPAPVAPATAPPKTK